MLIKNIAAACMAFTLTACGNGDGKTASDIRQQSKQDRAVTAAAEQAKLTEECKSSATKKRDEYQRLTKAGDHWGAALAIRQCADLLQDEELKKLTASAEIKSYSEDIENKSRSAFDRLYTLSILENNYPEAAKKYEKLRAALEAKTEINRLENERVARNTRDYRTPAIGTTDKYVRENGWGEPARINKTIDGSGVSEQWVYSNGKYLYFVNGKLTTIQE